MAVKPVQVSIDEDLLRRIDADPEVAEHGRSAFLRAAAGYYLEAKRRRTVDASILDAYSDAADTMADEIAEFIDDQAWPAK